MGIVPPKIPDWRACNSPREPQASADLPGRFSSRKVMREGNSWHGFAENHYSLLPPRLGKVLAEGFEGHLADMVLDSFGVGVGGLRIDAEGDEQVPDDQMPFA